MLLEFAGMKVVINQSIPVGEIHFRYDAGSVDKLIELTTEKPNLWQPIETAPKTGEPVLLYKQDERMVGEYTLVGYWGEWPGQEDCWIAAGGKPLGHFSSVTQTRQGYPMCWQPVPEPPPFMWPTETGS